MFWITAALALATTALYAGHSGDIYDEQSWSERAARASVGLTLVALSVGLLERARTGSEFQWIHWFIFTSLAIAAVAHTYLMWCANRDTRRRVHVMRQTSAEIHQWLAEVEHFEPCHNEDCERVRSEMRALATQLQTTL